METSARIVFAITGSHLLMSLLAASMLCFPRYLIPQYEANTAYTKVKTIPITFSGEMSR